MFKIQVLTALVSGDGHLLAVFSCRLFLSAEKEGSPVSPLFKRTPVPLD